MVLGFKSLHYDYYEVYGNMLDDGLMRLYGVVSSDNFGRRAQVHTRTIYSGTLSRTSCIGHMYFNIRAHVYVRRRYNTDNDMYIILCTYLLSLMLNTSI